MLVSNDFAIRMMGSLFPQVPQRKMEVTDAMMESVLRKIGPQQVFLDVSRCWKLTVQPFNCLKLCKSLVYLDVSYTKLRDLDVIAENCESLRGLNVSGLEINNDSYNALANLQALEVLHLRNCNIISMEWFKDMHTLRSLDLGASTVQLSDSLSNCTRLEELLLDGCPLSNIVGREKKALEYFTQLPELKVLNLVDTPLVPWVETLTYRIHHMVCFEALSRR